MRNMPLPSGQNLDLQATVQQSRLGEERKERVVDDSLHRRAVTCECMESERVEGRCSNI